MTLKRLARMLRIPATLLFTIAMAATAKGESLNTIKSLKSAGDVVELEITGNFTRSLLPVLDIGGNEYAISRAPDDGSVERRIFMIPANEFSRKLKSGQLVKFKWGRGDEHDAQVIGTLDKSRLDK